MLWGWVIHRLGGLTVGPRTRESKSENQQKLEIEDQDIFASQVPPSCCKSPSLDCGVSSCISEDYVVEMIRCHHWRIIDKVSMKYSFRLLLTRCDFTQATSTTRAVLTPWLTHFQLTSNWSVDLCPLTYLFSCFVFCLGHLKIIHFSCRFVLWLGFW